MTVHLMTARTESDELEEQSRRFADTPSLPAILDAIPSLVLIINEKREIIYANSQAMRSLNMNELDEVLGKRPGEAMRCENAANCPNGCGTGDACTVCGAANAIRSAELGHADIRECRIRQQDTGLALDFRVSTTPLQITGQKLTLVALTDISHENRRRTLERIFFHDLLNTLGALSGYVQLLDGARGEDLQEFSGAVMRLTETMAEQINEQRDLAAAENNDLSVRPTGFNARELLEQVAVQYRNHAASRDRTITIGNPAEPVMLRSDKRLLQRIISNMLKNALEATPPGGAVELTCRARDGKVVFAVHNEGMIPRNVQLQIFQRAFSTKGTGRGLGTYSMKLLGERYLRGQISFISTREEGTTFQAELPLSIASHELPQFSGK